MRLLAFPEELQEFVSHDTISVSVAEAIVSAPQELAREIISLISTGYIPTVTEIRTEIDAFTQSPQKRKVVQSKNILVDEILGTVLKLFDGVSEDNKRLLFFCPICRSEDLEQFEADGRTGYVCPACHHAIPIE